MPSAFKASALRNPPRSSFADFSKEALTPAAAQALRGCLLLCRAYPTFTASTHPFTHIFMESNSSQQGSPQYGANPSVFNNLGGQQNLPNATATLVLGIISIVGSCCVGGLIGLICGIIGLILGNKDLAKYRANPTGWTTASYNNAKAGRICAIIGIVLSSLVVVWMIIYLIMFGSLVSNPMMWQEMMNNR